MSRIVGISETIQGVMTNYVYGYDTAQRLTSVTENGVLTTSFVYDNNGNRTTMTIDGLTRTATYDDQDRLLSIGAVTFNYNDNGEVVSWQNSLGSTTSYTYDAFGHQTRIDYPSTAYGRYYYDAKGRMTGRYWPSNYTRIFMYQDDLRIAAIAFTTGVIQKLFYYATNSLTPDYMNIGGVTYRIVTNHLGSPRLVINSATGAVSQRMDYNVLGRVTADTNPLLQPFGFAGGLWDPDAGAVHFGARKYGVSTGRWSTKDPILFEGGDTNLYGYVANDPVNWVDPSGLIRDPRAIFDEALNHPDSSSGTNGPGNAFQHCFASCMMAGENGSATAAALGAGFEFINNLQGQKGDAYCMDTHNNQVGRDLARENGISNLTGISEASHRGVSSACAQACAGANSSGRLVNLGGR